MTKDQIHNSHNAPVPYSTIHHFGTEMCTFLFQSGALWDMGQVHCGICEINFNDLLLFEAEDTYPAARGVWAGEHSSTILANLMLALGAGGTTV